MRDFLHSLRHKFGMNFAGDPRCWTRADGVLMSGYQCSTCGKLFHVHKAPKWMQSTEAILAHEDRRDA